MKLYTFTTVNNDGDVETYIIQAVKKPTKKQALCCALGIDPKDEMIPMILDSYKLEIKPATIIRM
jgi:hypothetical protein